MLRVAIYSGYETVIRLFAVLLFSLMLVRPAAAHDSDYSVGWITALDDMTDEIMLHNGQRYIVSPDINFEMLAPGMRVLLEFDAAPLNREVTEILPIPQFEPTERVLTGV